MTRPGSAPWLDSPHAMRAAVGFALLWLVVLVGYPIAYNLLLSVQDVQIGNLTTIDRPFIGADNYRAFADDASFGQVVLNTVVFTVANVGLSFVFGLALALFFEMSFPGASYFRGLILAAWFLPAMVIGAIFKWLLATDAGLLNQLLSLTGLVTGRINWLSNPDLALSAVVVANVWYGTPFTMILLSAGLAGLPRDVYEASALDGAGAWRRFFHITLPMLRPTMLAVLALSTIYTLRVFDLLWTMTRGGPASSTTILPLWSYIFSFELFRFGIGAAVASLLLGAVIVVAWLYTRSLRYEQQA
jgi:multiple sugar transport system permease protein